MRTRIVLQGRNVYHEQGCWHLKNTKQENWIYINPAKTHRRGYRPCKCCSTPRYHLKYERKALNRFIEGKNMEYKTQADALYVKTEISCWKIIYAPKAMAYRIYHRNQSGEPIDFQHPELESYHFQGDKQDATNMAECFQYIYRHDSFRKIEQKSGGNVRMENISPKYRQQLIKKKRREERQRLESIFAELEQKHPEYAALAFC